MSCPLSALASIAAMAEYETDSLVSPGSSSSVCTTPSSSAVDAPDAVFSSSAMESSPRSRGGSPKKSNKPVKKRSVPAAFASCATAADDDDVRSGKCKKPRKSNAAPPSAIAFQTDANDQQQQPSFPLILMAILSVPQNVEFITFLSDERSFIIVHPDALARIVLPVHFEGTAAPTFDQFLYLLDIWGFETAKDSQYPEVNIFKHPMFRKGDWEACLQIKLPQESTVDSPLTQIGHHRAPIVRPEPSCTPRQPSPVASAAPVGGGCLGAPAPTKARSVTPPEIHDRAADNERRTMHDSASKKWTMMHPPNNGTTTALEQMIMATARSRQRLSGLCAASTPSLEDLIINRHHHNPSSSSESHHRGSSSSSSPNNNASSEYSNVYATMAAHMIRRWSARRSPFPALLANKEGSYSGLTDAQVKLATNHVVSAAVAALNRGEQQQQHHWQQQEHHRNDATDNGNVGMLSPSSSPSSSLSLDAMTKAFLERSTARRLQSRPAGILGPSSSLLSPTSSMVDLSKAALFARQKQGQAATTMSMSPLRWMAS